MKDKVPIDYLNNEMSIPTIDVFSFQNSTGSDEYLKCYCGDMAKQATDSKFSSTCQFSSSLPLKTTKEIKL